MLEIGTHGVYLSFDGVARHGASGPAFGHHGAKPGVHDREQWPLWGRVTRSSMQGNCRKRIPMQRKMMGFCDDDSAQRGLKLRSRLKPLHKGQTPDQEVPSRKPTGSQT